MRKFIKQDLIRKNVYTGPINRNYEGLKRYNIAYPGERPYQSQSALTLEEMQKKHAGAEVKLQTLNYGN